MILASHRLQLSAGASSALPAPPADPFLRVDPALTACKQWPDPAEEYPNVGV